MYDSFQVLNVLYQIFCKTLHANFLPFASRQLYTNVRYTKCLGDGDTKGFLAVEDLDIYEDVIISKRECIGHIQKCMGSRLRKLKTKIKGVKLPDGKLLSVKNQLTDAIINQLQNYYSLTIRRNTHSLQEMKKAVWALFYHKISTDDSPHHGLCPKGHDSWCNYQ